MHVRQKLFSFPVITALLCLILLGSSVWFGSFGDEQENFAAGWLISKGHVPYIDFFFHHTPLPFFVSSLFFPFALGRYWIFRLFMLLLHTAVWSYLASIIKKNYRAALILSLVLITVGLPTFHLQMFLADTLAALALLVLFAIWTVTLTQKSLPARQLLWVTALVCTTALWSSITTVLSLFVVAVSVLMLWKIENVRTFVQTAGYKHVALALSLIFAIPVLYAVTGYWHEFYWSVFQFNNQYYFPFRLAASTTESHHGFITSVVLDYWQFSTATASLVLLSTYRLLLTIKGVLFLSLGTHSVSQLGAYISVALESFKNSVFTLEVLAFLSLVFCVSVVARKSPRLLIPLILLSMTLRSRTNEVFHLSPFYVAVWVGLSFAVVIAITRKNMVSAVLGSLLYCLWIILLLPSVTLYHTQKTPRILPEMITEAAEIKKFAQPGDKLLVLGGNTMYYPLTELLPATRQMYYLPWFAIVPEMHHEVSTAVSEKKADLILVEEFSESADEKYFSHDIRVQIEQEYTPLVTAPAYAIFKSK